MDDQPKNPKNDFVGDKIGNLTRPLSSRGFPIWIVYILAFVGVIYLLNPTAGIFELLPDNLPIIGNLDDGVAAILIWFGLVEMVEGKPWRAFLRNRQK
ncbi:MAG: DUF1232 domain-containing protein [Anaerolineaceae bacterium]|nr:DUF1232 domain-containing protein [Anaerolineaceae bacterium]